MELNELLSRNFDSILRPILKHNIKFEEIIKPNTCYIELEIVAEWENWKGFTFNIYSNDHLIDGKRHFHLDKKSDNIALKIDFDGNILSNKGKGNIKPKEYKVLKQFLGLKEIRDALDKLWEKNNPT